MLRIISNRNKYFIFSGALALLSAFALISWGLKFGIDFTGGTLVEVKFPADKVPAVVELRQEIAAAKTKKTFSENLGDVLIQPTDNSNVIFRLKPISEKTHQEFLTFLNQKFIPENSASAKTQLKNSDLKIEELRFQSIGPTIGRELQIKTAWAAILASILIIIYIAWAFRGVSRPVASWKYGLGAIIALFHDVLIVTGIFAILGHFFGMEIDVLFVSALLTVLGYSVNDTIVVYDRTRENLKRYQGFDFEDTVNRSVNETMMRSLNTGLATLFVLVSIYLFGGETIKNFALALILGIIFGTYSSIFVASPLLVVWHRIGLKKRG